MRRQKQERKISMLENAYFPVPRKLELSYYGKKKITSHETPLRIQQSQQL